MSGEVTFEAFCLASHARLLRQLTAMTGDLERAKDVLQEAYARAWVHWGRVAALDEPEAWVRRVAWRLAVSQHRRSATLARLLPRVRADGEVRQVPVDEVLDVQRALRELTPEQRRALVLFHVVGLSVEAIAAETGASTGTVKSRLFRGRAAMAARLGPEYRASQHPAGAATKERSHE